MQKDESESTNIVSKHDFQLVFFFSPLFCREHLKLDDHDNQTIPEIKIMNAT